MNESVYFVYSVSMYLGLHHYVICVVLHIRVLVYKMNTSVHVYHYS